MFFQGNNTFHAKAVVMYICHNIDFGELANALELGLKYKDSMGEDILKDALVHKKGLQHVQLSMENILHAMDNTISFFLQDKLEQVGTCLENFNLLTPDKQKSDQDSPSYTG